MRESNLIVESMPFYQPSSLNITGMGRKKPKAPKRSLKGQGILSMLLGGKKKAPRRGRRGKGLLSMFM